MKEVTHCHNERPIYESYQGDIIEWDDPLDVSGEKNYPDYPNYHPVVFDIETSAELGQRPILLVAFDSLAKDLIVLYSHGYQDYVLNNSKIKSLINFETSRIIVDNLSQSNFEEYILRPIHYWNKKARKRNDNNRKSLVAHNSSFDIPMSGSPDDELLDSPKIGDQYEMSIQYNNVKMVGHRAGQFGHIYQFLDSSQAYKPMYIPVGDTMVSAKSLWIPAKLKSACETLNVDISVSESEKHGDLNDEYVKYCINDVIATYKLYEKLNDRLESMFGNLPVEHIYSTASIGKYVLKCMGYKRVGYEQNAVDRISKAYFGGRTDAEVTGEIVENLRYTDILSEYPTVSELTNVWDFMKCNYVTINQIGVSDLPEINDLRNPDEWDKVANYYVKIQPKGATLPIRTPHLEDTTKVVTSNVFSNKDMMYHYMDVISAKLIDGKEQYEIVAAWEVKKHDKQNLQSFEVADVTIDESDNVMAKAIEARKNIQLEQGYKDETTLSLKIVANSLYGCTAERLVKEKDKDRHDFASKTGFYNPHVATTITAGGRLMLALGEHLAKEYGGKLVYCDTDSLILPDKVSDKVIKDFESLNPYSGKAGNLQVLEDEKEQVGKLYAVGTKKYIFFSDGKSLEVKEHGLGNYENLRDSKTIKRLWATIMYYDTGENPLDKDILYAKKLNESVIWSFNATTRSMRTMIDEMTEDYIRYGDWVQSTISYDNSIRYMALNLMEKEDSDKIAKMKCEGESVVEINTIEKKNMLNDERVKTVRDIVMKFVEDSATPDQRPDVNVTDFKVVTKEATSRKDIFTTNLQRQFNDNLEKANTMLNSVFSD